MNLNDPVGSLPLVGPIYAKRLEKLGIKTIEDLLYHFPSRYDDFSLISPILQVQPGETITICGQVLEITSSYSKNGKKIQKATVEDKSGKIQLIWFNQPFLEKTIKKDETYNFSGKCEWFGHEKVLLSPEYELIKSSLPLLTSRPTSHISPQPTIHTGRLVPVYPETYGVSSKWLRSRINTVLAIIKTQIEDFLPAEIRKQNLLIDELSAIEQIHFPNSKKDIDLAKYRLAFDELFLIQLSALIRKNTAEKQKTATKLVIEENKIEHFIKSLPFTLTNAQKKCTDEILNDMASGKTMNRLLQGDVGSGKTVIAAIAAYITYLNGYSTLIMAPTEILANQHYATFKTLLKGFEIPVELITSSNKKKSVILNDSEGSLKDSSGAKPPQNDKNTSKVIVGTHALLYQEFSTESVGLVVVDEQHRFGVEQRAEIGKKGLCPHILTMTATPIPRTIALTLFGDLEMSVIDEMPKGRIPVKTWVVPKEKRTKGYEWIRSRIKNTPEQAFIICPLIEESESLSTIKAATKEYEVLSKTVFPDLRLGLLHGKMKSAEKEAILNKFKEGGLDILVATPVVEVGIDVPNATIMLIEAADRFGLAQLHQLRGRVGRSSLQSYCLLFTENNNPDTLQRLKTMEKTNLGIELAEADLKVRGPGEIFGFKQHGFPDLKAASLTDLALIQKTRSAAIQLLTSNFSLLSPQYTLLKKRLERYKIETVSN